MSFRIKVVTVPELALGFRPESYAALEIGTDVGGEVLNLGFKYLF